MVAAWSCEVMRQRQMRPGLEAMDAVLGACEPWLKTIPNVK